MNAINYRVDLKISPFDFPPIMGLGQSSVDYRTEPPYFSNNKVVLKITMKYILIDMGNNKENEVLSTQSLYEIPPADIKSREDVYEFYKDATLSLNEAYQLAKNQFSLLPVITFPTQPIELLQQEIDGVFYLLNSRN